MCVCFESETPRLKSSGVRFESEPPRLKSSGVRFEPETPRLKCLGVRVESKTLRLKCPWAIIFNIAFVFFCILCARFVLTVYASIFFVSRFFFVVICCFFARSPFLCFPLVAFARRIILGAQELTYTICYAFRFHLTQVFGTPREDNRSL